MGLETVIYLTNIIICAIIAVLMTEAWMHSEHRTSLWFWMVAAWIMLVADVLFATRPLLLPWVDRIVPTLLVTVGQVVMWSGSRLTAERPEARKWGLLIIALHAIALTLFYWFDQSSPWRRVTNGVIWAGLSFVSYRSLKQAPLIYWKPLTAPAKIFALHAGFHIFRLLFAFVFEHNNSEGIATAINIMGDLEVSFFMVALFVGLLLARIQQRNQELTAALAEVRTLSGLLPICAWCKKIRDDDGYWQQVDQYFRDHSQIRFTHGVCTDCADEFRKETTAL